jgi:hypothetical protein
VALFGDEARVMFRPFRTYRELAALGVDPSPPAWVAIRGPIAMLFFIAGFVSITSAGRLVWYHVLFGMIGWSFLPVLQIAFLGIAASLFRPRSISFARAIDLFYAGVAPWFVLFFALAAVCLFSGDSWAVFEMLLGSGALFIGLTAAIGWSSLLTFAFFRAALGLGIARALAASGVYYASFAAAVAVYYAVTGQLLPLVWGTP